MPTITQYLIECTFGLFLGMLLYKGILRHSFGHNRGFFWLSVLLWASVILPAITFGSWSFDGFLMKGFLSEEGLNAYKESVKFRWIDVGMMVYLGGVGLQLFRFIDKIFGGFYDFKKGWSTGFLGRFSVDILLVLLWFHPLLYWYRRVFKEEYQPANDRSGISKSIPMLATFGVLNAVILLFVLFSLELVFLLPMSEYALQFYQKVEKIAAYPLLEFTSPEAQPDFLRWGEKEIQLYRIGQPDVYTGVDEARLADIEDLFQEKIEVKIDGKFVVPTEMDLVIYRSDTRAQWWLPNQKNGDFNLTETPYGNVLEQLQSGDIIGLLIKEDDFYLDNVILNIDSKQTFYEPYVKVKPIPKEEPPYGFQLVNRLLKKALLKLDTHNLKTRPIYQLYQNKDQYEVVHIPDFATHTRFVQVTDDLFYIHDLEEHYLSVERFDYQFLPEYQDFYDREVSLRWGQMTAAPYSTNYTLPEWKSNKYAPLRLKIGDEILPIENFRMTVLHEYEDPVAYHSDRTNDALLQRYLRNIKERTTIFIDEVIIQKYNRFFYLPLQFSFSISTPQDQYRLTIDRIEEVEQPLSIQTETTIRYENYKLSDLVLLLSENERLVFNDSTDDRPVRIIFESNPENLPKANGLILEKLHHQFHYDAEIKFENRKTQIIQVVDTLLFTDPILPQDSTYTLRTIKEVVMELEKDFDLYAFDHTRLKTPVLLPEKFNSIDEMQEILQKHYGLGIILEEKVFKIFKVK